MFAKLLLSFILVRAVLSQVDGSAQCSVSQSSPVKVSITSQRNETGHWILQVRVDQEGNLVETATSIEVEHSRSSCLGNWSSNDFLITHTRGKLTAPPPRKKFVSDYILFVGVGNYKFHNVAKTFEQARQTCGDEGAHLAVINSETEFKVLVSLFGRFTEVVGQHKLSAWIGIQRIGEDHFSILGPALNATGFARWSPGEPTKGNEYCVTMNIGNGGLVDLPCNYGQSFICEQ